MSRFKRFAHSLASGYLLVAANILYTLASVPLALHYLSKEEFGLWALVMQICNFNQVLIDLGMSSAIARILIDHKDDRNATGYGTVIQTGLLVLCIQGGLIALVGGLIGYWLPHWMIKNMAYWHVFRLLVIWQCVLLAVSFTLRIFNYILQAHQRFDICNYSNMVGFAVGLAGLWIGFTSGWGLYSMLLGSGATIVLNVIFTLWQTWRLRLFPEPGCWGKPNWSTFKELFFYGTDMFLVSIGVQLITASQAPVISRTLGLEAVAIWWVAIKLFTLSQQLVYRMLDYALAAFSEMIVRGEKVRLQARFRDLVMLTGSAGAAIGVTMALCNSAFLSVWTHNKISWPVENDILMACSLMVYASTRCHIGLACITKKIGVMKYIYFAEGLCFVCLGLVLSPHLGLPGVILAGIVTNLSFSGVYGMRRSAKYFNLNVREILFHWLRPPIRVCLCMILAAVVVWYPTRTLSPLVQLLVRGSIIGIIAALCFWRLGLTESLRREGQERLTQLRSRFAGGG
jgi:O-antigen/teichoic acid export membrane protein